MILLKRLRVENFKLLRRLDIGFPRRGAVLVEGLNESGKSTLFESVYFALYGAPLVAEGRGRGNLESVIRYGADAALVELWLEVGDAELEIRRWLGRRRPSQASLAIRRAEGAEERVAGVQAVNARVVQELGGLDGEALLNSCFVEQKKLSKLEDLAGAQRRDSLRKLLNLERLTDLAEGFRVTSEDERMLAGARDRLELAEVEAELPMVAAERAKVEEVLAGRSVHDGSYLHVEQVRSESDPSRDAGGESGADTGPELDGDGGTTAGGETPWRRIAADLTGVRRSAILSRRRGTVSLAAGALMAASGAALHLGGLPYAAMLVPLAVVLALLSARDLRRAKELAGRATHLELLLGRERDSLVARMGELEGRRRRLAERVGRPSSLGIEECRREVAELARRMEVKRCAAELLDGAMERMVRMVLPNTERNLSQILPALTAGRYHEARIGQDYQIQVWDDAAGRYVSKSVFSGGARDQFSLALRLAFALATLPQELGTTPGFLFLDEPLSSFDGPRTEALVRLLTTGEVGESFSQIFVISHNRSFDVDSFQYRLVLSAGRVVESNLPTP